MRELIILCAVYSISLFYRGMISVIAPEVSADLFLNDAQLGLLASCFFLSFSLSQIPSGIALDHFGGRLTISISMWFSVLGVGIFSVSSSFSTAMVGMAFIGLGCSPAFTGAMLYIGRRYSANQFAMITAMVIAIGSVGDLLGTFPLGALAHWLGWRKSLQLIMLLTMVIAVFSLALLKRDNPQGHKETFVGLLKGMARTTKIPELWLIAPMFLVSYGVLMAIRGLWGGPYLDSLFSATAFERGSVLMAMSVAMAIGTFILGLLDRKLFKTKWIVFWSSSISIVPLIMLSVLPEHSIRYAMVCFILLGLFAFNYPLLMSHSRTFLEPKYYGRGMAMLTAISMAGVFMIQAITGSLLEWASSHGMTPASQYRLLFIFLASCFSIAILIYSLSRESGQARDQKISR